MFPLEDALDPGVAVADQDRHAAGQGVDDPVFAEAEGEVLLALDLVVAGLAPLGDDLEGQDGRPMAAVVLGGTAQDHGDVGVAPRDHAGEPEAELARPARAVDDAGMCLVVTSRSR